MQLKHTVLPNDASNKAVTYTSSNSSVASVTSSGKVTARKPGSATITVSAKDGSNKKAICKITVRQSATAVRLNKSSVTLYSGKAQQLKATVLPSNAYNKNVTFKSSNPSVASVASNGKITAKKAGTVIITATAKDGSGKKATCKVVVKQSVTAVKLNTTSATLNKGKRAHKLE